MKVEELTKTTKARLVKNNKCIICGSSIEPYHDVQVIKYRHGRFMEYHFLHTECIKKNRG